MPASCNTFTYKAAKIWNKYRTHLNIYDFEISVNPVKASIMSLILSNQNKGNDNEWNDENFCNH